MEAVGNLDFNPPTPANNTYVNHNWTEVNLSITSNNISSFIFNWNGTNYSVYDDSLVLALNFNNNSAIGENNTLFVDNSKYGNNGTCNNAGTCPNSTAGKFGNALQFDGVDDYVTIPSSVTTNISENSTTISLWYKSNNLTQIGGLIGKITYWSSGWRIYTDHSKVTFSITNNSGNVIEPVGSDGIITNNQ